MLIRAACFFVTLIAAGAAAASADPGLVPPAGWTHVDSTGAPDPQRTFDTWKQSSAPGSQTLTLIKDLSSTYADAVARVKKNFADNNIHAAVDEDKTCQGVTGHVFEFTTGPDSSKFVVDRTIVPLGTGVETLTYVRSEKQPFDNEVKTSIAAWCSEAQPAAK